MPITKTVNMVNIYPSPVTIRIDGAPGGNSTEYTVEPGKSVPLPETYCKPVPGAGNGELLPSIIARESARNWPDSDVRAATLVPEDDVERASNEVKRQLKNEHTKREQAAKAAARAVAAVAGGR